MKLKTSIPKNIKPETIGFDAFFPKRIEKKYKHKVRITKF